MRWFRSADSNGSTGCSGRRGGDTFGLGTRVVIVPSWRFPSNRIKQLRKPQERAAINYWLLSVSDSGANDFVEHPGRHTPSGVVRELHIKEVALTARATEDLQLPTEQRMIRIEDFCGF
jgi:hypothetical protein